MSDAVAMGDVVLAGFQGAAAVLEEELKACHLIGGMSRSCDTIFVVLLRKSTPRPSNSSNVAKSISSFP
jgi:hypothetical protein